jgi:hypothetical protein
LILYFLPLREHGISHFSFFINFVLKCVFLLEKAQESEEIEQEDLSKQIQKRIVNMYIPFAEKKNQITYHNRREYVYIRTQTMAYPDT